MTRLIAFAVAGVLVGYCGWDSRAADENDDPRRPVAAAFENTPAMRNALQATIDVDFKDLPLQESLVQVGTRLGVSVVLDGPSLKEAKVDPRRLVTVKANGMRATRILEMILHPLNLAAEEREDHFLVVEKSNVDRKRHVRFYPVADFVLDGSGGWIDPHGEMVSQIIIDLVDRDVWEPNGGDAVVAFFPATMALTVYAPRDTQEKVFELLGRLRQTREQTIRLLSQHNLPLLEDVLAKRDLGAERPLGAFEPPNYPPAAKLEAAMSRFDALETSHRETTMRLARIEADLQRIKEPPMEVVRPKTARRPTAAPTPQPAPESPTRMKKKTDDSDF
jgi:hypothetical protein